jgi:hypothetical protein
MSPSYEASKCYPEFTGKSHQPDLIIVEYRIKENTGSWQPVFSGIG